MSTHPESGSPAPAPRPSLTPSFVPGRRETSRVMTSVPSPPPHRGWFSRGYVPHWDHPGMIQSLTFRLHDSLPSEVVRRWKAELGLPLGPPARMPALAGASASLPTKGPEAKHEMDGREIELRQRIARHEDEGHGECWLGQPRIGGLVEAALLHFDGERYRLLAWCVMPNHVHVLVETELGFPLPDLLHGWKSYSANEANRILGRRGVFWQREYVDRYLRNQEHFTAAIRYIEGNPSRAGLVKFPAEWPFSSARYRDLGAPAS